MGEHRNGWRVLRFAAVLGAAVLIPAALAISALAKADGHPKKFHTSLQSVGYLHRHNELAPLAHSTRHLKKAKQGPTGQVDADNVSKAALTVSPAIAFDSGCLAPTAPGSPAATGGANQASVTWTAADGQGNAVTGYVVTAFKGTVAENAQGEPASATSATLTGLASGSYTFQVVAQSACGSGPAATTTAKTVTGSTSTYASTAIGLAPSAYFRLGEPTTTTIAADSSGHHLLGGYNSSGITLGATGALPSDSGAASVNDTSGTWIAQVPQPNGVPVGNAPRTVQAWVKPADTNCRFVLGWGVNGTDNAYSLGECPNSIQISAFSDDLSFATPEPLTDGAWHLITVTYNSTNVTAYEDGRTLGTRQFANALSTSAGTLELGAYENLCCNNWAFGGVQDEAVYPQALTAAQITSEFNASGYAVPAAPGSPTATTTTNTATVKWTAATAPGTTLTGYIVTAKLGATAVQSIAAPPTATTAKLSGLKTGSYTFTVAAVDAYGTGTAATTAALQVNSTATTYASTVLADRPSVFYRLDEATGSKLAADSSGRNITASYANSCLTFGVAGPLAVTDTAPGVSSTACNNIATVGSSAGLPSGTAARTLQAWVKPSDGNCHYFMGYGTSSINDGEFGAGTCGNSVIVRLVGDDRSFFSARTINDGHWHLVTVTDSYAATTGNVVTAYLDGQRLGSQVTNALLTPANTGLDIGQTPSSCCYPGGVADAAVYPAALSAAQISALLTASGNSVPTAPSTVTATVATNSATVSWHAATATGATVSGYVVTALQSGIAKESIATSGLTAKLTSLPAGSYTFSVVARDTYGAGPAATSAAATVTGGATTYASTVLASRPALYYRLDDPAGSMAADSSGNGTLGFYESTGVTHGTVGALHESSTDAAATQTSGPFLAEGGGSTLIPSGDANRTIEAWIKPSDASCTRQVAGFGATGTDQGFALGECPNQVVVDAMNDARTFQTPRPLNDGSWHFLAATYNDTGGVNQVTAYLDGVSLGTKSFAGGSLSTPVQSTLWLGAGPSDCCTAFVGGLDEVAVFPSALSAATVASQFTASGQGAPAAPTGITVTTGANLATVKWAAATSPSAVTSYVVTAFNGSTPESSIATASTARTATLNGLRGGTAYTFHVVAYDAYGPGPAGVSPAATPTGGATTYSTTVLGDGPVAYYKLAELSGSPYAAESTGKGTLATYNASATTFGNPTAVPNDGAKSVTDNGNDAVAFDGTLPGSNLPVSNNSRTVVAWTKLGDANCRYAMGYGSQSQDHAFGMVVCPNSIDVVGWSDDHTFGTTHTLDDGAWHQVAITFDGTNLTVYVDGVSLGTQQFTGTLNTPVGSTLYLGAGPQDAGSRWFGGLADIAIFPTALSGTQIGTLFSASGYAVPTAPTSVAASPGANQASVSWTGASAPNTTVTGYVVTALLNGTTPANSVATNGATSGVTMNGLKGASSHYTFRVVAVDAYGTGPAGTSSSTTVTGTATTFASDVIADGPSAYYRLGEENGTLAADSSPNEILANYNSSAVTFNTTGALTHDPSTAITDNGSNYAAFVPDGTNNVLPTGNSARSVAIWIKPADTACRSLVAWGTTTTAQGFGVGECPGSVTVTGWSDDLSFSTAPVSLTDGNWHFVVVTYDGAGNVAAYVDGTALSPQALPQPLNTVANTGLIIGRNIQFQSNPADGGLQDAAVFPTQLSAAQVTTLYGAR